MSWTMGSVAGKQSATPSTKVTSDTSQENNVAVYEFKFQPDEKNVDRANDTISAKLHNRLNANRIRVTLKETGQKDMSLYFERGYDRLDEDSFTQVHYTKVGFQNRGDVGIYYNPLDVRNKMFKQIGSDDMNRLQKFGRGIYKFAKKYDVLTTLDYSFIPELVNVWTQYITYMNTNNQESNIDTNQKHKQIILHMTKGILEALNEDTASWLSSWRFSKDTIRTTCNTIISTLEPQGLTT
jgi:hypothetical protein